MTYHKNITRFAVTRWQDKLAVWLACNLPVGVAKWIWS